MLFIICSSLLCINFAGGDDKTQWSATLDKHETVQCVCVGGEFVAIATSSHMIRGFSTAGFQLAPFMLPGAPVAMSGYNNVLFVVYHTAPGEWKDLLEVSQCIQNPYPIRKNILTPDSINWDVTHDHILPSPSPCS